MHVLGVNDGINFVDICVGWEVRCTTAVYVQLAIALEQGGAIYHVVCKFNVVSVLYI